MGAGEDDGVVGDGEGRGGLWAAAAGRPEIPGLRLPEVIRGQQTVHLRFAAAACCNIRRGLESVSEPASNQWLFVDRTDMGLYSSPSVATD